MVVVVTEVVVVVVVWQGFPLFPICDHRQLLQAFLASPPWWTSGRHCPPPDSLCPVSRFYFKKNLPIYRAKMCLPPLSSFGIRSFLVENVHLGRGCVCSFTLYFFFGHMWHGSQGGSRIVDCRWKVAYAV